MAKKLMNYVVKSVGCVVVLIAGFACASLGDAAPSISTGESRPSELRPAANGAMELRQPASGALLVDMPTYRAPGLADGELGLFAYHYATHVYVKPEQKARTLGLVRRGTLLRAAKAVDGPGCARGTWYELADEGYACEGRGFTTTPGELASLRQLRPNMQRAVPYRYGKVNSRSALRYYRLPSAQEEEQSLQALAARAPLPDIVADKLDGDYFVAIDREEADGTRRYYRTVLGRYVRVSEVDLKPAPAMQGQLLDDETSLPLAFVYGAPQAPLFKLRDSGPAVIGQAVKHARFTVTGDGSWGDQEVVVASEGYAVARQHVRVARTHARPKSVAQDEKWLHVDLTRQTLVAYRGDTPVFATLVSTGREGFDTPAGLFRIHEKHKTRTMRGSDTDGPFEVAEVPWTMFYRGSYALHGAYWHDDFGNVRSHGCINLSPIDARWLFHFTDGSLPTGWHARRQLHGTALYVTRES